MIDQETSLEPFVDVSMRLLEGYAELARAGFRPESVGLAMLGASINFYRMFNLETALPDTLRAMADHIETGNEPS